MATVAQVVKASLQQIVVQASEAKIEASDAQDFIFAMNNYMLDLDAKGVTLGYTVVDDLGDDITIPTGALRGLIMNMAIEMAPQYLAPVTRELALAAKEGLSTMRTLGLVTPQTHFPSTLPRGSGNEDSSGMRFNHFYPDQEAEILAETTGAIGLETDTP